LLELAAVIAILGVLAATLMVSMNSSAKLNKMYLLKQQCISACRSQLDNIAVTGKQRVVLFKPADERKMPPDLIHES